MLFKRMMVGVGNCSGQLVVETAVLLGLLALLAPAAVAATVYVDGVNGNDAWSGLCATWDGAACGPKATIQAGMDAAGDGDEVLIADGVYTGAGNRDLDFGGKAITVRSVSADSAACVIDCESQGRGFIFASGESASSVVRGLTIGNGLTDGHGGGVYCDQSSPTLSDCIISANRATNSGGGVGCYGLDSRPTLTNCVIAGNSSPSGAGVSCGSSGSPTLINCTIWGNTSDRGHGRGGGLYCVTSAEPVLSNCILWANLPEEIYVADGQPTITYSDVQGGWEGIGNIADDPALAFATDFHLLPESPCVDAGTNNPAGGLPPQDIEGQPRAIDGRADGQAVADMGAYELNPAVPAIALSATELTFIVQEGQSDSQTLSVRNSSCGTLAWELSCGAGWLNIDPASGASSGEVDVVALTVGAGDLAPGRYATSLYVTDPQASNSPRRVTIVLYVGRTIQVPGEYPNIQAAIDAAQTADEVILADGVYSGEGNRDLDFGGKAITVCSASGDPQSCVIDCEQQGRGFYFHSHERSDSVVRGITVQNGSADHGGGVYCNSSGPALIDCVMVSNLSWASAYGGGGLYCLDASPELTNCRLTGNVAEHGYGGAISCYASHLTLTNCPLNYNSASLGGGGVFCGYSTLVLVNSTILDNTTDMHGGGFHVASSDVVLKNCAINGNVANGGGGFCCGSEINLALTNCVIFGNTAGNGYGGGLECERCSPTLANCRLSGNTAEEGGALYLTVSANAVLSNCEITGNAANDAGGGIHCDDSCPVLSGCTLACNAALGGASIYCQGTSAPTLTDCILWGNTPDEIYVDSGSPTVAYCDVRGGWEGVGNIDADPVFADMTAGHVWLLAGSPCIDSGNPAYEGAAGELDLDGRFRLWDGDGDGLARVDMGAYEFGSAAAGDVNCDGLVNGYDIDPFVLALTDPAGYAAAFPTCDMRTADLNYDGAVNGYDIDPFVAVLTGQWQITNYQR
jgi:hypothetical protein